MVDRMSSFAHVWIWPYAFVIGVWTYMCTRGSDGELVAALAGLGLRGVAYWAGMVYSGRVHIVASLKHLAILEAVAVLALMVHPQLDEMGGMLNIIIPAVVFAIVIGGLLARLLHPLLIRK